MEVVSVTTRSPVALAVVLVGAATVAGCCPMGPSMRMTPSEVEVVTGGEVVFRSHVDCLMSPIATWSATCGTVGVEASKMINIYRAPAEPGSCTVTATSVVRSDVSASALVTVIPWEPGVGFEIAPAAAELFIDDTE
jgi:hypothetical protein